MMKYQTPSVPSKLILTLYSVPWATIGGGHVYRWGPGHVSRFVAVSMFFQPRKSLIFTLLESWNLK